MFIFRRRKRRGLVRKRQPRKMGEAEGVMAEIAIAAAVPAHGFVFQKGAYSTGSVTEAIRSPFSSWMRTFLGACAWAFMIAAGSLVYSHFVKKWQGSGLPMLPVAAMITASQAQQQQQQQQGGQPAGGLTSGMQFQRAKPPAQTTIFEEYVG
jgi:hypothetical protein